MDAITIINILLAVDLALKAGVGYLWYTRTRPAAPAVVTPENMKAKVLRTVSSIENGHNTISIDVVYDATATTSELPDHIAAALRNHIGMFR